MIDLSWGASTHPGRVRDRNEDALLASPPVFVVADGMGGHAAGEVASEIAIDHFRRFTGSAPFTFRDVTAAIRAANDAIVSAAESAAGQSGMGTTVVGLIAVEQSGAPYWLAFNIGDSRLYRLWNGELTQITVDHSYVQELVASGRLSSDDAMLHPERNVVTRALGHATDSAPDFWMMPPAAGERFLLCSDGVSAELGERRIRSLLLDSEEASDAAAELLAAALSAGGRDNITAVVVDVRAVLGDGAVETTIPRGPLHG